MRCPYCVIIVHVLFAIWWPLNHPKIDVIALRDRRTNRRAQLVRDRKMCTIVHIVYAKFNELTDEHNIFVFYFITTYYYYQCAASFYVCILYGQMTLILINCRYQLPQIEPNCLFVCQKIERLTVGIVNSCALQSSFSTDSGFLLPNNLSPVTN